MRFEIEKRLHRVKINLNTNDVKCPHSQACNSAENCNRCNHYYAKCTKFKAFK